MKCPSCNLELGENAKFCPVCGTNALPVQPAAPAQKLMGPWAYVGWQLLFSIPLVGFILLVILSFDDKNLNRRNFARSYWCALLIGLIVLILLVVLLVVTGFSFANLTEGLNIPM